MIWYVSWTTLYLGSFRKACAQAWIRYRILFRTFASTCLCRGGRARGPWATLVRQGLARPHYSEPTGRAEAGWGARVVGGCV